MAIEATIEESAPTEEPSEEPTEEQTEETSEEPTEESEVTVEALASDLGWKPKDRFQGDDETYVDAATYIRRGEDIKESMRQHLKDNRQKMTAMERGIQDLKTHNERVFKVQLEKQRKEIEDLRSKKREAIEEGDADKVDQIEGEMLRRYNSMEEADTPQSAPELNQEEVSAFDGWRKTNDWYGVKGSGGDNDMTLYADRMANTPEYANLPYERKLKVVTELVKKAFPDKFRKAPSSNAVEGARTTTTKRTFTTRDLSGDQRAVMKNFVNRGIMTEKQYIADLAQIGELQ